ncbi:hypothetical protein HY491_00525 [Candidatus Woesearchaeota archaeon]|nr:hypothetical protein [Candidatus Woesearchaeota archaeon]
MTKIFQAKDKTGREIYLTDERWRHILKHPEMSNQMEQIKDALLFPDAITKVSYDANLRFYYRHDKSRREYLFVSVKYLNGEGFIITSFYTDRIR